MNPEIEKVEIKRIGYLNTNSGLYDSQGSRIKKISAYQLVKVFGDKDDYYVVEYGDKVGLIPRDDITTLTGIFVVTDLSEQKTYLYSNTDNVFSTVCTTGWNKRRPAVGAFKVYEKANRRFFSEGHEAKKLWANFDNGNGYHDADWEDPKNFGSESYRKHNGSNGCVRLPDESALFLRDYIEVGTKVLIKD